MFIKAWFTPSGKKDLIPLLNKCNFNHEKGEYSSINYSSFKKVFLDDIIQLEIHNLLFHHPIY